MDEREAATARDQVPERDERRARWQWLLVLLPFWAYVTLSNVLYAHVMSVGFASVTQAVLFAPAGMRVLQHLLLLPFIAGCYALSLKLGWRPLWRRAPLQGVLALGFAALAYPALALSEYLCSPPLWSQEHMHASISLYDIVGGPGVPLWAAMTLSFLLSYGFGLALITGLTVYRRFRDAELRVGALQRAWSATRLSALRMQLSPHTLFNLLHTIRGQIAWDPPVAQSMIVQLADLLRHLLAAGERELSRLSEELQLVGSYLELQQRRFSDRLSITLPDAASLPPLWVPSLILYPLAENAIVHGLAGHDGAVQIRIAVAVSEEALTLTVSNTVAGAMPVAAEGIGLRNLRERLAVQFGARARLEVSPDATGQWVARIVLPALRALPASGSLSGAAPWMS